MRAVLYTLGAAKLGGVVLPFPDVADPPAAELPTLPDAAAAAAPQQEEKADDSVAPWTPPTMAPDEFASSPDAFKHPSAAVVKDWETAPKVEMFAPLPAESDVEPKKEAKKAALPVVKSQLEPIITHNRDDDPELAAIQKENPMAYGIVKALLLKKAMGLALPGASAGQRHEGMDGAEHAPASSGSIPDMFNWKPSESASGGADAELAAVEQTEEVTKAPAPAEPAAPAPETIVAEPQHEAAPEPAAPEPAAVEQEPEKPKAAMVAQASSLSDFLGTGLPDSYAAARPEPPAPKKDNSYTASMAAYMKDLA